MPALRRYLWTTLRALNKINPDLVQVYTKLLKHASFDPIRSQISEDLTNLDPYVVSQKIGEVVRDSSLSNEQAASIHNRLIEELTRYNYGVAATQLPNLKRIGWNPTTKALHEMIVHNPGRVQSSWDLFVEFSNVLPEKPSDELLLAVLDSIVNVEDSEVETVKESSLSFRDLTQAIYLLDKILHKESINQKSIDKIVSVCLDLKASILLPFLVNFRPSASLFLDRLDTLTPYQIKEIYKGYPFELLKGEPRLLHRVVNVLGAYASISQVERAEEVQKQIEENIERIKKSVDPEWELTTFAGSSEDTRELFTGLVQQILDLHAYADDLKLCKLILRNVNLYGCDTQYFKQLYKQFDSVFPNSNELRFESFLLDAFQAYKTSKIDWIKHSSSDIPTKLSSTMQAGVVGAQVIAYSTLSVNESLDLFNENIEALSREKDPQTDLSPTEVAFKALTLAFLSQKDLDFARLIIDKATQRGLLGVTGTKDIKRIFAGYGSALENKTVDEFVDSEIRAYFRTL